MERLPGDLPAGRRLPPAPHPRCRCAPRADRGPLRPGDRHQDPHGGGRRAAHPRLAGDRARALAQCRPGEALLPGVRDPRLRRVRRGRPHPRRGAPLRRGGARLPRGADGLPLGEGLGVRGRVDRPAAALHRLASPARRLPRPGRPGRARGDRGAAPRDAPRRVSRPARARAGAPDHRRARRVQLHRRLADRRHGHRRRHRRHHGAPDVPRRRADADAAHEGQPAHAPRVGLPRDVGRARGAAVDRHVRGAARRRVRGALRRRGEGLRGAAHHRDRGARPSRDRRRARSRPRQADRGGVLPHPVGRQPVLRRGPVRPLRRLDRADGAAPRARTRT